MGKWETLATQALADAEKPVLAEATNVTKFGTAGGVLVTSILAVVLGSTDNLDSDRVEVVLAAGLIVAAVVLGVYYAVASDLRTRGAATIARLETLGELTLEEMRQAETARQEADALSLAIAARDAAIAESEAARAELAGYREAAEAAKALAQAEVIALPPPVSPSPKAKKRKKGA